MHTKKQSPGQLGGIKGRLVLFAAGVCIALVGLARLRLGEEVVRHWTGQPFYSAGLVAVGAFVILMAFVPVAWISKAVQTDRSPSHHGDKTHTSH